MLRSFLTIRRYFSTLKYYKTHQWSQYLPDKQVVRVGITDHAQSQLGEIVHFEMPEVGKEFAEGDSAVVIESVKTTADVYVPAAGKIVSINQEPAKQPNIVNQKPMDTWLIELSANSEPAGGISEQEYFKYVKELAGF